MANLQSEELEVITQMNPVYFGERGRPSRGVGSWTATEARFAANYFLKLIEGRYIDPSSGLEQMIKEDSPKDLVIRQALCAFTDFTDSGYDFLYHKDTRIPDEIMKQIALRLIEKIGSVQFADRSCAEKAIYVLTFMPEKVLPSARNTWLEDHNIPPRVPYDADITNKILIPEAIEYARKNILFLK